MAAFSYQPHPFLLDSSIFFPNCSGSNPKAVSSSASASAAAGCFMEEFVPNFINNFSPFEHPIHESSCLLDHDHSSKVAAAHSDNEPSVTKKQSTDDSTVVDKQLENSSTGDQLTPPPPLTAAERKRKPRYGVSINSAQSKEGKLINKKQRKCSGNDGVKNEKKAGNNKNKKDEKKRPQAQEGPTGYIHVRARRGQATDSHSLAERVRREKISERMKILQRLVPGCDKVTGKALMLDEIINYVQSLQNQVEFLSMKLASVNPMFYDFGVDLEALMVRPERVNGSITTTPPPPPPPPQAAAALPCLQLQCNPTQLTAFADSTTFASAHNYPLLDAALLLQQGQCQRPHVFSQPQDNGNVLWDVEDQRQKFLNASGLNDNLCSFH